MLTASYVLTALGITVVLGAGATAYLWFARRKRMEIAAGIKALSGMRWREFSRFVIEALQAQGFQASLVEPKAEKGQQSDLLLNRGNQTWLLSCKQGINYTITATQVSDLARSVREAGAGGGIFATLGRIEPGAGTDHPAIELMDGASLWALIDPLLPPSLHQDLATRARGKTLRGIQLAWLGSLLTGLALALLLSPSSSDVAGEQATDIAKPTDAAPAPAEPPSAAIEPLAAAPVPVSENEQRNEARQTISTLPGFNRAVWSSRSTLLVSLQGDVVDDQQIAALCSALERYEVLRASRIQLQPPAGSTHPVRFMQCHTY